MEIREELILDMYSKSAEEGFDYQRIADIILLKYHVIPKEKARVTEIPKHSPKCIWLESFCRDHKEENESCPYPEPKGKCDLYETRYADCPVCGNTVYNKEISKVIIVSE